MTLQAAIREVQASDAINPPNLRRPMWLEGAHVALGATEFHWYLSDNCVPQIHAMCIDDVMADDWELVPVVIDEGEGG